jgi:vacuolar protein sorting-associated protein 16
VATLRDPRKVYRLNKHESTSQRNLLSFYHSDNLEFLLSCPFNEESEIQNMGWSHDERLVCVLRDGTIVLIRPSASESAPPQRFQLPRVNNMDSEVEKSVVFSHGVVVSTSSGLLVAMEDFDRPHPLRLSSLPLQSSQEDEEEDLEITSLAVVTRDASSSSSSTHVVRVLVALSDGSVYSLSESTTTRADILSESKSPITHLQVAPRGHFVASINRQGILDVFTSDFQKRILHFDTSTPSLPLRQLVWCGEDSVVLHWESSSKKDSSSFALMVGPQSDWLKYELDSVHTHMIQEIDGVRVLTPRSHTLIQRVPSSLYDIRSVGSTSPSALLVDALNAFKSGKPQADGMFFFFFYISFVLLIHSQHTN